MNDGIGFRDVMKACYGAYNPLPVRHTGDLTTFKGQYQLKLFRKGILIAQAVWHNLVTNEGKNLNLDVCFGATAKPTWYMGLIDTSVGSSVAVGDTMNSHAGWAEFTGYAAATRPVWTPAAATSQQITNTAAVSFAINATATIAGGFTTTNNTKGGTSGTLWSGGTFSTINVVNGDTLRLTYSLTAS